MQFLKKILGEKKTTPSMAETIKEFVNIITELANSPQDKYGLASQLRNEYLTFLRLLEFEEKNDIDVISIIQDIEVISKDLTVKPECFDIILKDLKNNHERTKLVLKQNDTFIKQFGYFSIQLKPKQKDPLYSINQFRSASAICVQDFEKHMESIKTNKIDTMTETIKKFFTIITMIAKVNLPMTKDAQTLKADYLNYLKDLQSNKNIDNRKPLFLLIKKFKDNNENDVEFGIILNDLKSNDKTTKSILETFPNFIQELESEQLSSFSENSSKNERPFWKSGNSIYSKDNYSTPFFSVRNDLRSDINVSDILISSTDDQQIDNIKIDELLGTGMSISHNSTDDRPFKRDSKEQMNETIDLLKNYGVTKELIKKYWQPKEQRAKWDGFCKDTLFFLVTGQLLSKFDIEEGEISPLPFNLRLSPDQALKEMSKLNYNSLKALRHYYERGLRGEHLREWMSQTNKKFFMSDDYLGLVTFVEQLKVSPPEAIKLMQTMTDEELKELRINYNNEGDDSSNLRFG